jgi:3-phosphoshikimate 1-carboxyvinyltransferase
MMKVAEVYEGKAFDLEIDSIASDKSISHRCAMFSLYSDKPSIVRNFLEAEDTLNTLNIVTKLGASVTRNGKTLTITPPAQLIEPSDVLDCGNSGTGMRLFCGLLASHEGFFILSGDEYLRRRPMKRVTQPLADIGANLDGRDDGNIAPIAIRGGAVKSFNYQSKIASAQVKSAMILAALKAKEPSTFSEPHLSRDHTERMLNGMGASIVTTDNVTTITPITGPLSPLDITVPADPSSAFFFAVAAAIIPGSRVLLKNVTLNPTRIEAFHILKKMGAKINFIETENLYEPLGDIEVSYAPLKAVTVEHNMAWLIDELPALSIAFAVAQGTSVVKNAHELRVKESDRIKTVVDNLNLAGIKTIEVEDGYSVVGGSEIKSATFNSYGDHRIAMSFMLLSLLTSKSKVEDIECIETSFPNFIELLSKISKVENGSQAS